MPTIKELFLGSNKDITPKRLDLTPVQELFAGSTQEKSVKPDKITLIEQELSGIRIKSKVELNNPLIYGNEAIRIATRSTSSVEKMKQATGGSAADGGLIGKGLGAITGGKFGKFVFGGKVTSLSQARDGVNSRIGIPQNVIPTYVNNTGELQAGNESDTMITLSKIKNDAAGTIVGKFLKQTGGGTPKTIGKQILGQGISLGKDKLRTSLFGNPNSLGANTAGAADSFDGIDSGGKKPANGSWEYSSISTYKDKINKTKNDVQQIVQQINLKLVSPIHGIIRKEGKFGTSDYAFEDTQKIISKYKDHWKKELNDPTNPYSGVKGAPKTKNLDSLESKRGITSNDGDLINSTYGVGHVAENGDDKDLVTFSITDIRSSKKVYFRTLVTSLSETVTPSWDSAKFVGNPYSYYTYGGVERSLSLQLKMYCMNSIELATMWERMQFLTSLAYPTIDGNNLVNPPFVKFTLGHFHREKPAFINSLSYTIPDDGVWETELKGKQLPKIIEVQMEFKYVEYVGIENELFGFPLVPKELKPPSEGNELSKTKKPGIPKKPLNINKPAIPKKPTVPSLTFGDPTQLFKTPQFKGIPFSK